MPSASAKLEKQASTEACEPIKQCITIIEHKIRNLEKRKLRLESYRDQQSSGKDLNSEQLSAIAKYDEVQHTLEFARGLCKQFSSIAVDTAKQQKKQARKDAVEKSQQELLKIKEILLIQDILTNMGQDTIREDFLAARNGALKLTEEDFQHLDDLFTQVCPKREVEDGCPSFSEQVQKSAEHLLCLAEGKNKEIVGTTYAHLRQKILEIHTCGYFEGGGTPVTAPVIPESSTEAVCEEEDIEGEEDPVSVPTATFQSTKAMVPPPIQSQPQQIVNSSVDQNSLIVIPPQPQVSEVIPAVMSVTNSSFHFLQDSELDLPDVAPTAPPPSALPIPTQTFTNQNFVPTAQTYAQQPQPAQSQPQPQPVYTQIPIADQQASYASFTMVAPLQHQHQHQPQTQPQPQPQPQPPQPQPQPQVEHVSDWSDVSGTNVMDNSDWNSQCEAASVSSENAWQQQKQHHHQQPTNSWGNDNVHHGNDGFMPAGGRGGSGRGGRSRGSRGGPRGGGRGSGGGSGGNYYRINTNENSNNYYQSNGLQNRNSASGDNRRGGPRVGAGGPRSDRGGARGSSRGGRGGNRQ